jgi:hypothetical protein
MRRLVVATVVVVLAFSLVGCGGGGGEEAATDTAAVPPPPPAAAPALDPENPIPDKSQEETAAFVPFPVSSVTPTAVADRLKEQQPMVMLFVDEQQKDTNDQLDEVNAAMKKNQGTADLLIYDVGAYTQMDKNGKVITDPALSEDESAQRVMQMAASLGVNFTPYTVLVDDQGYVFFRHSGFIDEGLLDRQMQRLTE